MKAIRNFQQFIEFNKIKFSDIKSEEMMNAVEALERKAFKGENYELGSFQGKTESSYRKLKEEEINLALGKGISKEEISSLEDKMSSFEKISEDINFNVYSMKCKCGVDIEVVLDKAEKRLSKLVCNKCADKMQSRVGNWY